MGGLTSIASAAANPPGVVAYINFAGGTGGDSGRAPKHSCGSEEMATLMRSYGRTTHVPGLWLYAENDLYWGAEWPRAWYRAFSSGGGRTEFVMSGLCREFGISRKTGYKIFNRYKESGFEALSDSKPLSLYRLKIL